MKENLFLSYGSPALRMLPDSLRLARVKAKRMSKDGKRVDILKDSAFPSAFIVIVSYLNGKKVK